MCGIAGVLLRDPTFEVNMDEILDTLLIEIEPRGDDATGFVAISDEGVAEWQKASCPASTFTLYRRPVPHGTRVILAHTRWATQGLPSFIENNHPIQRGPFFIIHNGHVRNDDVLFANAERKRFGRVDSEAIAARLSSFGDLSELGKVIEEIEGDAAVAAVDERDASRLVVARGNYSPLYVYNGRRIVLFASTQRAIEQAHAKHIGKISRSRLESVEVGKQLEWKAGDLVRSTFQPKASAKLAAWSSSGRWSSGLWHFADDEDDAPKQLSVATSGWELDCEACGTPMSYAELETRYDPDEKLTYLFCGTCADLWDWDEFGDKKEDSFLIDVEAVELTENDDEDDNPLMDLGATDDYANANASILRNLANRLF